MRYIRTCVRLCVPVRVRAVVRACVHVKELGTEQVATDALSELRRVASALQYELVLRFAYRCLPVATSLRIDWGALD